MRSVVVVSASFDPVMRVLASYATRIASETAPVPVTHLHDRPSHEIAASLQNSDASAVFFFLHGQDTDPYICDGAGGAVIETGTIGLLGSKTVCGTCYSADRLAQAAAPHGAAVVGYHGPLYMPLDQRYADAMVDAALAPHRSVLAGLDVQAAAAAARSEYRNTANKWYARGSIAGQVYAALADANAHAMGATP